MNRGCPYSVFDWDKMCEVCKLTDKPTGDAVMCDFGYDEECEEYIKKCANKTSKRGKQLK